MGFFLRGRGLVVVVITLLKNLNTIICDIE